MPESIIELIKRWESGGLRTLRGEAYNDLHAKLHFFQRHFSQYLPALGADSLDYEGRLELWLHNVTDEGHKRSLLELAAEILFFTREDFLKLHQSALYGPIKKWIIEKLNLDLLGSDLSSIIDDEIHNHTWFCSLTDSMPIADFYHANNLAGTTHRPDCRSLARFGDLNEIDHFMQQHRINGQIKPLKRIVVLEDFVGSGTQMNEVERQFSTPMGVQNLTVFEFLDAIPSAPEILFVPLIICPEGLGNARITEAKLGGRLTVDPVLQITQADLINTQNHFAAGTLEAIIKDLAQATYPQVVGNGASHPRPYEKHGFHDTGAKIVMFSNTPANTLPLIHHKSNTWEPLFRRSARVL